MCNKESRIIKYFNTSLVDAVIRDDCIAVRKLIKLGASVDQVEDSHAITPLHHAVAFKSYNCIKILLDHGANIDRKNSEGVSAIDLCIERKDHHLISLFSSQLKKNRSDFS